MFNLKKNTLLLVLEVNYQKYLRLTVDVQGWMSFEDFVVLKTFLDAQRKMEDFQGQGALEIGCFEGKSALWIGSNLEATETLHLCDVFDGEVSEDNRVEVSSSYPEFKRFTLEQNLLKLSRFNYKIWDTNSNKLLNFPLPKNLRLIHIDGSHLYSNVKKDIETAVSLLEESSGIIVLDDFRQEHTLGVSAAIWEGILLGLLKPLAATPSKLYVSTAKFTDKHSILVEAVKESGLPFVYENIFSYQVLRLLNCHVSEDIQIKLVRKISNLVKRFLGPRQ